MCQLDNFNPLADQRVEITENENLDKYHALFESKKLWNMKVTVIVIEALGIIHQNVELNQVELKIRGRIETVA